MVAANVRLPNIRRMFVPDTGYIIVDADLSGADAQVVAWEAGDEDLKLAFKQGLKIHVHNARAMFDHEVKDMTDDEIKSHPVIYKAVKRGVHATNYGASVFSLMASNGWSRKFAEMFLERWFHLHPAIKEWHHRYERYLQGTQCWNCDEMDNIIVGRRCPTCDSHLGRTIKNRFGFRIIFFDRVDALLPKALAWTPQSTVAFCTELGWTSIAYGSKFHQQFSHAERTMNSWEDWMVHHDGYSKYHDVVDFLIQVHDSIVFQVPWTYEQSIPDIVNSMLVRVPYDDPLIIPMGWGSSRKSWGEI